MYVSNGHKQPAVLCILKSGDRFLLLKRKKEPNKGKYTPVGGKIDPYENPIHSAIRETLEETGIRITNPKYCGVMVESSPTNYNWICFVYLAEIEHIDPPACKEGTLEWIGFSKLFGIPAPKTDWHIYKYLVDNKNFMFNIEYDQELNIISMREEIENKLLVI
ncbi:MAG: NUDIX domain-containing protein [Candidatus Aureabacteria bacterium]|nr:NUDIX domain-containing protein [Candidatus Auribacterota bacterium]